MNKKITAIIPVYNGEKYLARCIDSVLQQDSFDITSLEVLLLNDGSKDGSLEIIEQFKDAYPNIITIINQDNIGVAKTRNKAIRLAAGEYIIFIDQDDWINSDYCATFYETIHTKGLDVVSGGYIRPDDTGKIHQKIIPNKSEYSKYILMAAWAKIHRTKFLIDNNIEFFANKFGEDNIFTVKEINSTDKWEQINYLGYNWFFNEASVSNTIQKGLADNDNVLLVLEKTLSVAGREELANPVFHYYLLRTIIGYLMFSGRRATADRFIEVYHQLFSWLENNFPKALKSKYVMFSPIGETLVARCTIMVFVMFHKLHLVKFFAKVYANG